MGSLNTKNTAIVTIGLVIAFLGAVLLGVLGNNHADQSRERIAVACVRSGGEWTTIPNTGSFQCVRK